MARTRRRLLLAARAWSEKQEKPPGSEQPDVFMGARAGSFLHDPAATLDDAYRLQLEKAVRWSVEAT